LEIRWPRTKLNTEALSHTLSLSRSSVYWVFLGGGFAAVGRTLEAGFFLLLSQDEPPYGHRPTRTLGGCGGLRCQATWTDIAK
jgi:hypothetical protein